MCAFISNEEKKYLYFKLRDIEGLREVHVGDKVEKGQVIAESMATSDGMISLGQNILDGSSIPRGVKPHSIRLRTPNLGIGRYL